MSGIARSSREQLWQLLPEVYRYKDEHGHLAAFIETFGELLGEIEGTLQQRLEDTSLETCQPWLIPYWADLLKVSLVSPTEVGRRREISNAINWRQRKGRRQTCIEIAKHVGDLDVVAHEGHTRVATTAQIGLPRSSMMALGENPALEPYTNGTPAEQAQRPGTPAVTVDFRRISRASRVTTDGETIRPPTATSQKTDFGDGQGPVWWQQPNRPLGVPLALNGYQDLSVRTVDTRSPSHKHGHHHPKRVLFYTPVPAGFFPRAGQPVVAPMAVSMLIGQSEQWHPAPEEWHTEPSGDRACRRSWQLWNLELEDHRVERAAAPKAHLFERHLRFRTCASGAKAGVLIDGDVDVIARCQSLAFENLIIRGRLKVACEKLHLNRFAAYNLTQPEPYPQGIASPLIVARNCLFNWLWLHRGTVQLEYCTILNALRASELRASDCIVMPLLSESTCNLLQLRFSCAPNIDESTPESWQLYNVETTPPIFHTEQFGQSGCGVLHPATPQRICFGAEDGGELGAYHHQYHCLRARAVEEKLRAHLPIGVEPVLTFDPTWQPPSVSQSEQQGALL